jgi:YHS domain-containing protein
MNLGKLNPLVSYGKKNYLNNCYCNNLETSQNVCSSLKCSSCPTVPLLRNSWNPFNPILGGVDVVSYFKINEITPQTIYTNYQPLMGSEKFQVTYEGYTYFFYNDENLQLFVTNPNNYIPQFGGYCSFGITYEYCLSNSEFQKLKKSIPNLSNGYAWNANCLGPTSSRDCWIIIHGKLFLFYVNSVRSDFVSYIKQSYEMGSLRWNYFKKIWNKNNVELPVIRSTYSFPNQSNIKKTIY